MRVAFRTEKLEDECASPGTNYTEGTGTPICTMQLVDLDLQIHALRNSVRFAIVDDIG